MIGKMFQPKTGRKKTISFKSMNFKPKNLLFHKIGIWINAQEREVSEYELKNAFPELGDELIFNQFLIWWGASTAEESNLK